MNDAKKESVQRAIHTYAETVEQYVNKTHPNCEAMSAKDQLQELERLEEELDHFINKI